MDFKWCRTIDPIHRYSRMIQPSQESTRVKMRNNFSSETIRNQFEQDMASEQSIEGQAPSQYKLKDVSSRVI